METKKIEVWVSEYDINKLDPDGTDEIKVYSKKCFDPAIKAMLIIELPERKIEITESQFDEAFISTPLVTYGLSNVPDIANWKIELKQKLFGGGK